MLHTGRIFNENVDRQAKDQRLK